MVRDYKNTEQGWGWPCTRVAFQQVGLVVQGHVSVPGHLPVGTKHIALPATKDIVNLPHKCWPRSVPSNRSRAAPPPWTCCLLLTSCILRYVQDADGMHE